MCRTYTGISITYLEYGGHFGRHLEFLNFNMFRKNAILIFFLIMISPVKIKWVFAFTKQNTRNYKCSYTKYTYMMKYKLIFPIGKEWPKNP